MVIPGLIEMHEPSEASKNTSLPLFVEGITKTLFPPVLRHITWLVLVGASRQENKQHQDWN